MNWGTGITIAISTFIIFIISLVTIMISKSVDLESEEYYQREITYESEIVKQRNAESINKKIQFSTDENFIRFDLDSTIEYEGFTVDFVRPNNKKQDQRFDLGGTKKPFIHVDKMHRGSYQVIMQYKIDGIECMQKEKIII